MVSRRPTWTCPASTTVGTATASAAWATPATTVPRRLCQSRTALARDQQVRGTEPVGETDGLQHRVDPAPDVAAEQQQPVAQPAGGAGPGLAVQPPGGAAEQVPGRRQGALRDLGQPPEGRLQLLGPLGRGAHVLRRLTRSRRGSRAGSGPRRRRRPPTPRNRSRAATSPCSPSSARSASRAPPPASACAVPTPSAASIPAPPSLVPLPPRPTTRRLGALGQRRLEQLPDAVRAGPGGVALRLGQQVQPAGLGRLDVDGAVTSVLDQRAGRRGPGARAGR